MRIALVHSRLLWQGGLESRLFSYTDYLVRQGHEVTIITYKVGQAVSLPDGVQIERVNLSYIPRELRPPFFNRRLGRLVSRAKYDFVLSLTKTSHQHAVLAAGNHLGFHSAMGKKRKTPIDRMLINLERKAFDSSQTVLAASQMMKDELVRFYGTDASKIRALFPPIDNRRFHPGVRAKRAEMRAKHGFGEGKKSFVFVSVSHGRKGLPLLLELFRELRDEPFELIVAGDKPDTGGMPNVKHVGFVRDTSELYAAADYFVLPAVYEPFGQVVAEALLCGVPVLLSHMVGAREVVTDSEGLVIPSFDPRLWVEAVRSLSDRKFAIDADFGRGTGLYLDDHMRVILDLAAGE